MGVELPYVGVQFKRLGKRGLALEIVVEDQRGREGVVRLSSWKVRSTLRHDSLDDNGKLTADGAESPSGEGAVDPASRLA